MILVATDLDDTLVGDAEATEEFFAKIEPLRHANKLKLVYATGRSLERFLASRNNEHLIDPDALIAAVGTEIYTGEMYDSLDAWQEVIKPEWDRKAIYDLCKKTVSLKDQPLSEQRPFKISFCGDGSAAQAKELEHLRQVLAEAFPKAALLISHGAEFIDVMPSNCDKGKALKFLAEQWEISEQNVLSAGDSLNDVPMMVVSKAIVVGNAYPEVKKWYKSRPELEVYFAKSNCANGILEGLDHYLGKDWSEQ